MTTKTANAALPIVGKTAPERSIAHDAANVKAILTAAARLIAKQISSARGGRADE